MKAVYKYSLRVYDRQVVCLPKGSKILSVGEQNGQIRLWVLVETLESNMKAHTIIIHGTGHCANDVIGSRFIGTVMLNGGQIVFHVFVKEGGENEAQ